MPLEKLLSAPPLLELFSQLGEGIFSADIEGRFLSINQWGAQVLGYGSPEELLSEPARDAFRKIVDWERLGGPNIAFPFRTQFKYQAPGGRTVTIDAVLIRSESAPSFQFFGGFREVTPTESEVRDLAERNKELEALRNLAVDATRFEDQPTLLASMLQLCIDVVGAQGGAIYLYEPAHKHLVIAAQQGMPPSLAAAVGEYRLGVGIVGKVAVTRIPVFIDELSSHPGLHVQAVRGENIKNFASFPLQANDRLLGVMCLHTTQDEMITGSDFALLSVLSAQASLSLDHVRRMEELRERNAELEKFNRLSVDRELRMIELKKRIRELEAELKLRK
jgi:putative methionine-R-sulfoxide reductase with GAF domain